MRKIIRSLTPPILLEIVKEIIGNKYGWKGSYDTWSDAQNIAVGYDDSKILKVVKNSLLKVKNGESVYERDGVIFDEIQYSWPLLAGLMFASKDDGLRVLDFGGSLGSTYYQSKKFLDKFDNISWNVVEQKHFVDVGKKKFESDVLNFFCYVDECVKKENPKVLLFSSVLQYIEKPYELLDDILKNDFEYILIDRTPFSLKNKDEIKLQVVSPSIYKASYPCWFFDKSKFIQYFLTKGYNLIEEFDANDGQTNEYEFKGMILEKNA